VKARVVKTGAVAHQVNSSTQQRPFSLIIAKEAIFAQQANHIVEHTPYSPDLASCKVFYFQD
jgi:hypothetical protein